MMKRMITCLLSVLLLCAALPAGAEIVGRAGYDYIHRYTAPNGQEIFFVSMDEDPPVELTDVNGDGVDDVVIVTSLGASNAVFAFWVWDGEQYVWAMEGCPESGVYNYSIDERGRVLSWGTSGYAGALFVAELYDWDGPALRLLRRMVSENNAWVDMTDEVMTETTELERLRIRLWDFAGDPSQPGDPAWEKLVDLEDMTEEVYDEIWTRFTEGLE